jgi:hypothetical protein
VFIGTLNIEARGLGVRDPSKARQNPLTYSRGGI